LRLKRFLAERGPQPLEETVLRFGLKTEELREADGLLTGRLIEGNEQFMVCDRENYETLYRQLIARRRMSREQALTPQEYLRFRLDRHGFGSTKTDFPDAALRGWPLPREALQVYLLAPRLSYFGGETWNAEKNLLKMLAEKEWFLYRSGEDWLTHPARQGHIFQPQTEPPDSDLHRFLRQNGQVGWSDLKAGLQLSDTALLALLTESTKSGWLTSADPAHLPLPVVLTSATVTSPARQVRRNIERHLQSQTEKLRILQNSRWMLTSHFSVYGTRPPDADFYPALADLLIARHGLIVKENFRTEQVNSAWYPLFSQLKQMEWQGEMRRGFFAAFYSGLQFTSEAVLEEIIQLRENQEPDQPGLLLSTMDPALPATAGFPWAEIHPALKNLQRRWNNLLFIRNGRVVFYLENFGRHIIDCSGQAEFVSELAGQLKIWLAVQSAHHYLSKIIIQLVDGEAAAGSRLSAQFLAAGFEKDANKLVLWPSAL